MTSIIERYRVRQAVENELKGDPRRDLDAAIEAAAARLGLPVEYVLEAVAPAADELVGATGWTP